MTAERLSMEPKSAKKKAVAAVLATAVFLGGGTACAEGDDHPKRELLSNELLEYCQDTINDPNVNAVISSKLPSSVIDPAGCQITSEFAGTTEVSTNYDDLNKKRLVGIRFYPRLSDGKDLLDDVKKQKLDPTVKEYELSGQAAYSMNGNIFLFGSELMLRIYYGGDIPQAEATQESLDIAGAVAKYIDSRPPMG